MKFCRQLMGKKYISTIDLTKCFYQIPLREEDKIKTAFRTHRALYHHTVFAIRTVNSSSNLSETGQQYLERYTELCNGTFERYLHLQRKFR